MASLNKVFLIGNLTRDPELRYTPTGTAVVNFGLAVNRRFTNASGEKKEETCFVRVVVFGRQAESCNQYLTKGKLIFVEGRLQYRSWEVAGEKRSSLDVVAERVQFLGMPKEEIEMVSEEEMGGASPAGEIPPEKEKILNGEENPPF
ncbi:MAG: single-stranded DNA-binding protein [Candidatus Omnitrophica bacterium]|nr:single-stranded DNA-binding protein [Candidatus Omnitrophota bacterium]MCM8793108.1 single-stranded DNA-binding protein [Candidatus Omnitrophota bacterium]